MAQTHAALRRAWETSDESERDMEEGGGSKELDLRHRVDREDEAVEEMLNRRIEYCLRNMHSDREHFAQELAHAERDAVHIRAANAYCLPGIRAVTEASLSELGASVVSNLDSLEDRGFSAMQQKGDIDLPEARVTDSKLVQMQKVLMSFISAGILQTLALYLIYYLSIAMVHAVVYWSVPAIADFLEDTSWNESFAIVYFMISLIWANQFTTNIEKYDDSPRRASYMLDVLQNGALDVRCFVVSKLTESCACCANKQGKTVRVGNKMMVGRDCLRRAYVLSMSVMIDVYTLTKLVIPMHRALADTFSKDMALQRYFRVKLGHVCEKFSRMERDDLLRGSEHGTLYEGVHRLRNWLAEFNFGERYTRPAVLENAMALVVNIYLWVILPMQGFSQQNFYMIPVYAFVAIVIKNVDIVKLQLGDAFDIYHYRVQPNRFEEWTKQHVHDLFTYIRELEEAVERTMDKQCRASSVALS